MEAVRRTMVAVAVGLIVTAAAANGWGAVVVPNGSIDDQITFNLGSAPGGTLFYDYDPGTGTGALVDLPGNGGTGVINPVSAYPGPYSFDFDISAPLVSQSSSMFGANGTFGPSEIVLWDAEDGDDPLLTGMIDANFTLGVIGSSMFSGEVPFTVTGGSLASQFGSWGKLVFNFAVSSPFPVPNFNTDIYLGTGSIGLIVPEPATCLLLACGLAVWRRRR